MSLALKQFACFTLALAAAFGLAPNASATNKILHVKSDHRYQVEIKDCLTNGQSTQRLVIKLNGKTVLDQTDVGFDILDLANGKPYCDIEEDKLINAFSLKGDGVNNLVVRRWNGGAHGTYVYDIYALGPALKRVWHFYAGDGKIVRASKSAHSHGLPMFYIEDATFRYWAKGIYSFPIVPICWNGKAFAADRALMVVPPKKIADLDPAAEMLNLYYSGRGREARKLMIMLSGSSTDADYHREFVVQLKKSPFYNDVLAINRGQL